MSEYSDAVCCELCGEYVGDNEGYPVVCEDCYAVSRCREIEEHYEKGERI